CRRIKRDIDVVGEQALHGQSSAAIGHELNADADRILEQNAADVAGRPDAGVPCVALSALIFNKAINSFSAVAGMVLRATLMLGCVAISAMSIRPERAGLPW